MDSPPHLWDGVLRRLGTETASVALEAWLHPLAVREESDRLVLLAPTAFHRERVRTRFGGDCRVEGDRVTCKAVQRNVCLAAGGLGETHYAPIVFSIPQAPETSEILQSRS